MSVRFGSCGQPLNCGCAGTQTDSVLTNLASYTIPTGRNSADITDVLLSSAPGGHYVLLYGNTGALFRSGFNRFFPGYLQFGGDSNSLSVHSSGHDINIAGADFATYQECIDSCYKVQFLHESGSIGIRRLGAGPSDGSVGLAGVPNSTFCLCKITPKVNVECPFTTTVGGAQTVVHWRITNPHPSFDYTLKFTAICNGSTVTQTVVLNHNSSTDFQAYLSATKIPQGSGMRLIIEESFGVAPIYDVTWTLSTLLSANGSTFGGTLPDSGFTASRYCLNLKNSGYLCSQFTVDNLTITAITGGVLPKIGPAFTGPTFAPAYFIRSFGPCSGQANDGTDACYIQVQFVKQGPTTITLRFTFNGNTHNVTWTIP